VQGSFAVSDAELPVRRPEARALDGPPSQLIVMVGLGIAYTVTGGSSLSQIYHLYTNNGDTSFGLSCWILIFMACQLMLSQVGFRPVELRRGRQMSLRGCCSQVNTCPSSPSARLLCMQIANSLPARSHVHMHELSGLQSSMPCDMYVLGCTSVRSHGRRWVVGIFSGPAVVAQCKNFNDLRAISFAAAIMSLSYSTIAIGVTLHNGRQPNVAYNLNGLSTANGLLNAFNSLGIIAFACVFAEQIFYGIRSLSSRVPLPGRLLLVAQLLSSEKGAHPRMSSYDPLQMCHAV